jgi:bilin biosynthesis protein
LFYVKAAIFKYFYQDLTMSLEALFDQLKHPNPNLRDRAALEIAEKRDETTIPRLMEILNDEDVTYRRAAVKVLGVIGPDALLVLAESLTTNADPIVRASCAKAMAQCATNYDEGAIPPNAIAALKRGTQDENPVVHLASVMALGQVGKPAFETMVEILNETENVAVSVAIVNALGSIPDERSIPILQALSKNETVDPYIQEIAASALPRLDQVINYKKSGW